MTNLKSVFAGPMIWVTCLYLDTLYSPIGQEGLSVLLSRYLLLCEG